MRTQFSYFHAHRYGSTGYLLAENFSERHNAQKFKELIDREISSNKKVLFVKHHIDKYGGAFPIWVITELFTFGMLSHFYADLKTPDKKALARQLYGTIPQNIESYLRCVTDMRNIVAHYGRLYYRIFPAIPANIAVPETAKRKLWGCNTSRPAALSEQAKIERKNHSDHAKGIRFLCKQHRPCTHSLPERLGRTHQKSGKLAYLHSVIWENCPRVFVLPRPCSATTDAPALRHVIHLVWGGGV